MSRSRRQSSFLNGVPEMLVLQLLSRREMYGYELVSTIRASSADVLQFAEGVIYPLLHTLEQDGLLKARRTLVNGRPRLYYSLTRRGARQLDRTLNDWNRVVSAVGCVLGSRREPRMA